MGKKKDEKRARKAAEAAAREGQRTEPPIAAAPVSFTPLPSANTALVEPGEIVSASMALTKEDRKRLRILAMQRRTSLRRLMHQAWNQFLASQGLPGLTPVYVSDLHRKADRHEH
ncbi:hypothetical protein [Methylobacterium gnaphalii]|uniref:Uncharacterized protein n=1 Tax=Methylobacterium gnaphalii TaxID=1010610 RepID=A0A512JRG0_9HYPH|nr:hypothetical protein [Methylobacterium gnaphalii]GEP12539.1 hypothetical protein MGN01_43840 [Methylobacterium gnaphalii]GJD70210.1 hypothetical protein MMMDOFMJ_3152 [Methylobacterium gnaphalii]GLS51523.1 hypothetical protein GCM10007885_43810 [Methylobacterium gnaphalii]